jgi:hypothetical protein
LGSEYKLQNLITNKQETHHVKHLREFLYDESRIDPSDVATRGDESFMVDEIIDHTGDGRVTSEMDFKVRWKGYDENEDLWLPWKELRLNQALHEYLRAKNLHKLIPAEFRRPEDVEKIRVNRRKVRRIEV